MAVHFYEAIIKIVVTGDDASDAANEAKLWLYDSLPLPGKQHHARIRAGRLVGVREVDDEIVGDVKSSCT